MYYDRIEESGCIYLMRGNFKTFNLAKADADFSNTVYVRKVFEDKGKVTVTSWRLVKNKSKSFAFCNHINEDKERTLSRHWDETLYG